MKFNGLRKVLGNGRYVRPFLVRAITDDTRASANKLTKALYSPSSFPGPCGVGKRPWERGCPLSTHCQRPLLVSCPVALPVWDPVPVSSSPLQSHLW